MRARNALLTGGTAFATLALSACSFSFGTASATGEELARAATDALEEQTGERHEVDCGDDSVDLEEGKEVDCVLTEAASGTEYDLTLTITDVDGGEWRAQVQVADAPRAEDSPDAAESQTDDAAQGQEESGEGVVIRTKDLSPLVDEAFEDEYGSSGITDCGVKDVEITYYVGSLINCSVTDTSGQEYFAQITITEINGTEWSGEVEFEPAA
ncbi:DUF4333 domain-containing protein [Glycomyces buryatensis]|uniref:DUF4333 domain-containing protein n=1 Tax=Glycomyces buryatensis TaxID=2570927 RepID=UPI001B3C1520|nr:DUF4333 domain-containing protein [Glycomyces buryatensis]